MRIWYRYEKKNDIIKNDFTVPSNENLKNEKNIIEEKETSQFYNSL